jgi:hypothetical protein
MTLDSLLFWLKKAIPNPISAIIDIENVTRQTARVTHLYQSQHDDKVLTSCHLDLCGTVDVVGMVEIWAELRVGSAVFSTTRINTMQPTHAEKIALFDAIMVVSGRYMVLHLPVLHYSILCDLFGTNVSSAPLVKP